MKKILTSLLFLSVCGCYYDAKIVNKSGIKSIDVSIAGEDAEDSNLTHFKISNSDSIRYIVKEINNCVKEPIKFYPTHTMLFTYESGKIINITCNGSALMDNDGHTYRLKRTIKTILGISPQQGH